MIVTVRLEVLSSGANVDRAESEQSIRQLYKLPGDLIYQFVTRIVLDVVDYVVDYLVVYWGAFSSVCMLF